MHLNGAIVTSFNLELPLMLLAAYTVPAFAWLASVFADDSSTAQKTFAWTYFIFHFLVESYAFAMPIYLLHGYWKDPTKQERLHPIVRDTSVTYGHITASWYLIINSTVVFIMMIFTIYIACGLHSLSKRFKDGQMSQEARERFLEE